MLILYSPSQVKLQPTISVEAVCNQIKTMFNKAALAVIYLNWNPEHM